MNLHDVHRGIHKHKKRLRIGRGPGSGRGKTSGRGHKGQGQLAGWSAHPVFEGARMPLVRRIPKRGFHNRWGATIASVNLGRLDAVFAAGEEVTPETLRAKGVVKERYDFLKVLGDGQLTKPLKISAHKFSKSALEKIQQAGAEAVVLALPAPVVKKKKSTVDRSP
ncbi:MAG TPA: 50S ribosomal protein L15 [Pirellulales bacterium]|jgi:large subunit ribosomal protein L15|nr:50S ribosomal protein L15 [Pirellulales bacterium]